MSSNGDICRFLQGKVCLGRCDCHGPGDRPMESMEEEGEEEEESPKELESEEEEIAIAGAGG